jgi:proteasome assembly chaperone (PAC2) family protein
LLAGGGACEPVRVSDPLRLFVRPRLRDAALLLAFEGWNDAGQAASSALGFIEESVRCVPLGEIDCEEFYDFTVARPSVRLEDEGRRVEWPHVRFGYGAVDATREIVVGGGAEPHLRWRAFADACVALVASLGLHRVVVLGAYLADVVYSRPVGVTGLSSHPALLEDLGVSGSAYEGPTGIAGVLVDRFRREGLEVVSLWAGLPHYISASPNPRGALALVQKVMQLLDLKLDTEGLQREAARFEQKVSELVSADPELVEYVRQLKKREFAQ